jgi:hypothetical protein
MAPGVVSGDLQPVAHLFLHGKLQAMIDGISHVLPNPQDSLIRIEPPNWIDYETVRILIRVDLAA